MKPLRKFVLVEEISAYQGLIAIPESALEKEPIKKGRVLKIGEEVDFERSRSIGYGVGSVIYFIDTQIFPRKNREDPFLIHSDDIVGVDDEIELHQEDTLSIFALPEWFTFRIHEEQYNRWKDFENIRTFSFVVQFLQHSFPMDTLKKIIYEHCCHIFRYESVPLSVINMSGKDEPRPHVRIDDDVFDCAFILHENALEVQKNAVTIRNLVDTLPTVMRVCNAILVSPEFKQLLGHSSNRVYMTTTKLGQWIRLTGKGQRQTAQVRNWEVMQKLLRIEPEDEKGKKTLFGLLGAESKSLGRTDILIGFDKEINGHLYNVFLDVKAPTNEQSTLLAVEWIIQDYMPGIVSDRDYSHLLTSFFRDTVLSSFYLKWFENINCTTAGNK